MRLVYLSPVPWDSFAQRPHKFVEWFHNYTGGSVLWVDPYPTRFPSWRDIRRTHRSASANRHASQPKWLTLLQPGALPIEPIPGSGWLNGIRWRYHLRSIDTFVAGYATLLAIGKPSVFALLLLNRLHNCSSLYDAMDDFPSFYTGFSRLALLQREREIAKRVGIILASSSVLKARWESFHEDVRLMRNAVDQAAIRSVGIATRSSPKKIFGYVGTIATWFDWDWILTLAQVRPDDEIQLIGPVFNLPNRKLPNNIKLLPACSHEVALRAMTEFSVGLIPFKKNSLTAAVDPIKYYEYRALALPVISTDFGEMGLRSAEPGVFITRSLSDIPHAVDLSLRFRCSQDDAIAFASENDWNRRFESAQLFINL